jgi:hypothetical protein
MAAIFDHLKAAPMDLIQKTIAPDKALHIADLPLDDTPAPSLSRAEYLRHPDFRGEVFRKGAHTTTLPEQG